MSTDYTRVNVSVHCVHKPRTVSTSYAQCLQTTCICVYARIRTYLIFEVCFCFRWRRTKCSRRRCVRRWKDRNTRTQRRDLRKRTGSLTSTCRGRLRDGVGLLCAVHPEGSGAGVGGGGRRWDWAADSTRRLNEVFRDAAAFLLRCDCSDSPNLVPNCRPTAFSKTVGRVEGNVYAQQHARTSWPSPRLVARRRRALASHDHWDPGASERKLCVWWPHLRNLHDAYMSILCPLSHSSKWAMVGKEGVR